MVSASFPVYFITVGLVIKPLTGVKVILPSLSSTVHVPSPLTNKVLPSPDNVLPDGKVEGSVVIFTESTRIVSPVVSLVRTLTFLATVGM